MALPLEPIAIAKYFANGIPIWDEKLADFIIEVEQRQSSLNDEYISTFDIQELCTNPHSTTSEARSVNISKRGTPASVYYDAYVPGFFKDLIMLIDKPRKHFRKANTEARMTPFTVKDGADYSQTDCLAANGSSEGPVAEIAATDGRLPSMPLLARSPALRTALSDAYEKHLGPLQYVRSEWMRAYHEGLSRNVVERTDQRTDQRTDHETLVDDLQKVVNLCEDAPDNFLRTGSCRKAVETIRKLLSEIRGGISAP
jgi:hypothetical protein